MFFLIALSVLALAGIAYSLSTVIAERPRVERFGHNSSVR